MLAPRFVDVLAQAGLGRVARGVSLVQDITRKVVQRRAIERFDVASFHADQFLVLQPAQQAAAP